jgi:hypothetical protein
MLRLQMPSSNNVETMFIKNYLEKAASKDLMGKQEDGSDAATNDNDAKKQHSVSQAPEAQMNGGDAATNNDT